MSEFYDKIARGLNEAIAFEKGELTTAKTTKYTIMPVSEFAPGEIKEIRASVGMTQAVFAAYMGVSKKTVEAWESGQNHPAGAACRLLSITKSDPSFPRRSGIVA